jgi:hypothetical protein
MILYNEPLQKKRKLNSYGMWDKNIQNNKRKNFITYEEVIKKQKLSEYWSGRTAPIDNYDFLIISSIPNCIHRYIK